MSPVGTTRVHRLALGLGLALVAVFGGAQAAAAQVPPLPPLPPLAPPTVSVSGLPPADTPVPPPPADLPAPPVPVPAPSLPGSPGPAPAPAPAPTPAPSPAAAQPAPAPPPAAAPPRPQAPAASTPPGAPPSASSPTSRPAPGSAAQPLTSAIATTTGTSIAAVQARGLRIRLKIFARGGTPKLRRFRAVVIARDTRGFLVRGVTVRLRVGVKMQRVGVTGRVGEVSFVVSVPRRDAGARISLQATASTPTATARTVAPSR